MYVLQKLGINGITIKTETDGKAKTEISTHLI